MKPTRRGCNKKPQALALGVLAGLFSTSASLAYGGPLYLASFPHFNNTLQPDAPGDVDVRLQEELSKQGKFLLVQREFELYAWQLFLAINWPMASGGVPADLGPVGNHLPARWESWLATSNLADLNSGTPQTSKPCLNSTFSAPFKNFSPPIADLQLTSTSTMSTDNVFTASHKPTPYNTPLIDQNGNFVYYQSFIDENQVSYLCSIAAQLRLHNPPTTGVTPRLDFPSGTENVNWSGSYSIKLAWKVLDRMRGDDPSRYFGRPADILDLAPSGAPYWHHVEVGLVGMHIVHKTQSAPDRIWATFEHVDNLDVDRISHPTLRPSFFNPDCPNCVKNRFTAPPRQRLPTQVGRTYAISAETESLNAEAAAELTSRKSIWRFYKLVGVQWPGVVDDPSSATPPELANAVMETYAEALPLQPLSSELAVRTPIGKECSASPRSGELTTKSCISCHLLAPSSSSGNQRSLKQAASGGGDFTWFISERLR